MLNIGNKADLKVWSWDVRKSNSSDETLILLWVIILKGDLHLNGLLVLSGFTWEFLGLSSDVSLGDLVLDGLLGGHVGESLIRSLHLAILDKCGHNDGSGGLVSHLSDAFEDELVGDL